MEIPFPDRGLRVLTGGAERETSPVRSAHRLSVCRHHDVTVDSRDRRVTCTDCGATVDPFEALETVAAEMYRIEVRRDVLQHEAEQAERALAEVKRELKNARAARRRLR